MTDDDALARLDAEVGPLDVDWTRLPEVLGVLLAALPEHMQPTGPGLVAHPGQPRPGWVEFTHVTQPAVGGLVRLDLASLLPGSTAGAGEVRQADSSWAEYGLAVTPDSPAGL